MVCKIDSAVCEWCGATGGIEGGGMETRVFLGQEGPRISTANSDDEIESSVEIRLRVSWMAPRQVCFDVSMKILQWKMKILRLKE